MILEALIIFWQGFYPTENAGTTPFYTITDREI
jgi:hypothetical protein